MRRSIVVGNWKMNLTHQEGLELGSQIKSSCENITDVHLILAPPFTSLIGMRDLLAGSPVSLAAQNMFYHDSGAYTGEISPVMLTGVCEYVLIGHSERRAMFLECNEIINKKVLSAMNHGIAPILCVGESLQDRTSGNSLKAVKLQMEESLKNLNGLDGLMIAYEPVWAIGTGESASPEIIETMSSEGIRTTLVSLFGNEGNAVPILYGGSVNSQNVSSFLTCGQVDGVLVGGASLDHEQFVDIVKQSQSLA